MVAVIGDKVGISGKTRSLAVEAPEELFFGLMRICCLPKSASTGQFFTGLTRQGLSGQTREGISGARHLSQIDGEIKKMESSH